MKTKPAKTLRILPEQVGKRFDVVAGELFPSLSRGYIHRLIAEERITLNGASAKAGSKVKVDDKLETDFEAQDLQNIAPIELPIIYEDKDVLVINKPAGIISHSRSKYWDEPSVASFVRQKTQQKGMRAGIVHRLDRATSGVMVCAKNSETLKWLQNQFSYRKVQKTYIAIVSGILPSKEGVIDMPIERNPKKPATFRVAVGGKSAQTRYKVLTAASKFSLLELQPLTGRTHQLRVHLKQLGHPILGDAFYGGEPSGRLYLHALSLALVLPDHLLHTFEAPLPSEFKQKLE